MKNISLILTLNILLLSSMWNCGDNFNEMCEKYPLLRTNLHKYNKGNDVFEKIIEPVNKINEGLWALFEIALTDEFLEFPHCQKSLDVDFIQNIINKDFFKCEDRVYSCFYDVSNNNNSVQNNKNKLVYLFVSDINTVKIDVNAAPDKHASLFRGVKGIKKVKVIYSNCPKKKSHFAYEGNICELFRDCTELEEVNLENLNLNYLEVSGLFAGCENLKEVKLQRTPFKVYKHGGNETIALMFARIFYDENMLKDRVIKVFCTGQLFYQLINLGSENYEGNKVGIKSHYKDDNNFAIMINNKKNELKDSTYYRDFYIYLDELNQSYMIKKDEG